MIMNATCFFEKNNILKTHHENSESNSKVTDESQPKHQGSKMNAQASSKMYVCT